MFVMQNGISAGHVLHIKNGKKLCKKTYENSAILFLMPFRMQLKEVILSPDNKRHNDRSWQTCGKT